jgi:hypothetical protein
MSQEADIALLSFDRQHASMWGWVGGLIDEG